MREIKFRAWDKECEVMVYSDKHNKKDYYCEYEFYINNKNVYCMWSEDYDDICGFSKTRSGELDNIMQYTGLKDKNGKEIYDGDILEYETGYRDSVNYEDGCFISLGNESHNYLYRSVNIYNAIVVGNIYENPELLENNYAKS